MGQQKTLIIGGGLSAMMMARMIKKYRNPEAEIVIIERESKLGGQYSSFHYDDYGYFDIGMHMYYETCIPEVDKLLTEIFPEEEWNILADNRKDVAGVFYQGVLQEGTPYVDLRNIPREKWNLYVADIFEAIRNHNGNGYPAGANAYESLKLHFGENITDDVLVPVFEKIYFTHLRELDNTTLHLTTVNRVALFDEEIMKDLMKAAEIRARICYPDQLTMPPYRSLPQRGFYPRTFGFIHVINRLQEILEEEGVEIITSGMISGLEFNGQKATAAVVKQADGTEKTFPVEEIFWTAGLPSLANAMKIDLSDMRFEKKKTEDVYLNFIFDQKPRMGKLHHFFCFDKGYGSYRITNCSSYCPAVAENGTYKLCIEFWKYPGCPDSEEEILQTAIRELYDFGVIDDSYNILFSKMEKKTGVGFPLPSVANIENLEKIKSRILEKGIRNVIPTGVMSGKNVFYITDVLIDTYKKVTGDIVEYSGS